MDQSMEASKEELALNKVDYNNYRVEAVTDWNYKNHS